MMTTPLSSRSRYTAGLLRLTWVMVVAMAGVLWPSVAHAVDVTGRVHADGKPLAGVCISDGCRIVRTASDGSYHLPIDQESGRFVFVTIPPGYWTDAFYVPIAGMPNTTHCDFALTPVRQPKRFDFVFLTDMHLAEGDASIAKFNASLDEIQQLEPKPAFLLFQGDICLQTPRGGDLYQKCLERVRMPVRHGAGNHEMILTAANPRADFEKRFGPTYYSFNWGQLHCIVLDGNKPIPGQKGWQAVHGAVEGRELEWLEADLAAQPAGQLIVVGVHIPIVSTYPNRRQTSPANAPYWEMTNRKTLTDLLARYHVRLVLQGHMHENERMTIGGVEFVESISICGSWWQHRNGFERGVDNSPRGYRVIAVDGDRLTHCYQSSADSRVTAKGEFTGLSKPIHRGPQTTFVLNCYDAPNGSTAVAHIDDGPPQPMACWAAPSPATAGLTMPHHFRWTVDTRNLNPGPHRIRGAVTWPGKQVVRISASFQAE